MQESVIFLCPCGEWVSATFEPGYPDTRWEPGLPDYWYLDEKAESDSHNGILCCMTEDEIQKACYLVAEESWGETQLEFWPNDADLVDLPL